MKFETLKDNKKNKRIIGIVVFVVLVVGVATLATSLAKFQKTQSIPIVRGKVSYKKGDLNIVAIKQEDASGNYVDVDVVPSSGYKINEEKSYCEVNGEKDTLITMKYELGILSFINLKKGSKCYVYFDKLPPAKDIILVNKTLTTRTDFKSILKSNTTGTLYTAEDDDGTSYYYAGVVDDNWVKFGQENGKDIYWRIIRINGNGSIRMIYAGTDSKVTTGTGTQISNDGGTTTTYKFNTSGNDNAYVGFMYTSGQAHGLGTSSNAKQQLDAWYTNNLKINYEQYLDVNAGFCGDRTSNTSSTEAPNNTGGTGTTTTYYGARYRLFYQLYAQKNTSASPTYKCNYKDSNGVPQDLYTTGNANKGNKALTNPIGLITADEVAYAGGVYATANNNYYLYTNKAFWTLSPTSFDGSVGVLYVDRDGSMFNAGMGIADGLRPVINLSPDISFTGGGTTTNPYIIKS